MSFFVIILYINILKQFWYKVSSLIHIVFLYSDTLLVFYSFFFIAKHLHLKIVCTIFAPEDDK